MSSDLSALTSGICPHVVITVTAELPTSAALRRDLIIDWRCTGFSLTPRRSDLFRSRELLVGGGHRRVKGVQNHSICLSVCMNDFSQKLGTTIGLKAMTAFMCVCRGGEGAWVRGGAFVRVCVCAFVCVCVCVETVLHKTCTLLPVCFECQPNRRQN